MYTTDPIIIQGGMGVAVSSWRLARAVAATGQLGVVSGTGLDAVLARRLQLGDPDGHVRGALHAFPDRSVAEKILARYFIAGGKQPEAPFRPCPAMAAEMPRDAMELLIAANFVEIHLAKLGHRGPVGINYLEKIQLPTLPALLGALLAKVDYVLMGAGIPRAIPGILDQMCAGEAVELPLNVLDAGPEDRFVTRFDPAHALADGGPRLERPRFLAIVSSATLATALARKASGRVDGFVIEGPTAGGHNAPPRGPLRCNERGEPLYGPRDVADLDAFRKLERPFWLAGEYGSAARLAEALAQGAAGVQVGTPFAFCEESDLTPSLKRQALALVRSAGIDVLTDPRASPTGFPFKVLQLAGSLSDAGEYADRRRSCELGYLRQAYKRPDGSLGWRCPAENVEAYVRKGGQVDDTCGRKCLCNALLANVGLGQVHPDRGPEPPLVTAGDDAQNLARFLPAPTAESYSASDVIRSMLEGVKAATLPTDAPSPVPISPGPAGGGGQRGASQAPPSPGG
jgi:nitronate monooxygenase